ncbi:MAG: hypothetical protein J5824_01660 [Lachnospiraceae bacterium]|nr:hypothetical protein [Lachnospiraceae bacterium]
MDLTFNRDSISRIGITFDSEEEADAFFEMVLEELEVRIGEEVSKQCSDEQLDEFDRISEPKKAAEWLERNVPNYRVIVEQKRDEIIEELIQYKAGFIYSKHYRGKKIFPGIKPPAFCPKCGKRMTPHIYSCERCEYNFIKDGLVCISRIDNVNLDLIRNYNQELESFYNDSDSD